MNVPILVKNPLHVTSVLSGHPQLELYEATLNVVTRTQISTEHSFALNAKKASFRPLI